MKGSNVPLTNTAAHDAPYLPGEVALEPGVYLVMHYQHRLYHYVTITAGEKFPACSGCGDRVRFRLFPRADAIQQDADFAPGRKLKLVKTK